MASVEPVGLAEPAELDECFDGPVVPSPEPKRKRRKYRRYPRPECTSDQKKALWEHQRGL
jgi:hypothetical protein